MIDFNNLKDSLDNNMIDSSKTKANSLLNDPSINAAIQNTMSGLESLNELLNNVPVNKFKNVKDKVKEQGDNVVNNASDTVSDIENVDINLDNTVSSDSNNEDIVDENIIVANDNQLGNLNIIEETKDNNIDDNRLVEAFIGKNKEKILTKKFSLPTFFLNSLYMLYRKMFLGSISVFLIYLIISGGLVYLLFPSIFVSTASLYGVYGAGVNVTISKSIYVLLIYILVYIILGVIFGALFNKMYIKFVSKKVARISTENSEYNQKELETVCSLKGGTSMEKVILGMYVQITIVLTIITMLFLLKVQ